MMTQGIWKFSVFVTLTLIINFILYHVLTNLSLTSSQESVLARNLLARPDLERLISVLAQVNNINNINQTCLNRDKHLELEICLELLHFGLLLWIGRGQGYQLSQLPLTITR